MTTAAERLADELEEYASSRANFERLSAEERERVARHLASARAQVENRGQQTRTGPYGYHLIDKRSRFFYECGRAGIKHREAERLWWHVVYSGPPTVDKDARV